MKIFVGRVLVVIVWGLIWEITARTEALPPAFIGQPSLFLADFAEHIVDGTFPAATLITLQGVAVAFVIGALLALLTALAMTVFPIVERLFSPIVDALNALPRVVSPQASSSSRQASQLACRNAQTGRCGDRSWNQPC